MIRDVFCMESIAYNTDKTLCQSISKADTSLVLYQSKVRRTLYAGLCFALGVLQQTIYYNTVDILNDTVAGVNVRFDDRGFVVDLHAGLTYTYRKY